LAFLEAYDHVLFCCNAFDVICVVIGGPVEDIPEEDDPPEEEDADMGDEDDMADFIVDEEEVDETGAPVR